MWRSNRIAMIVAVMSAVVMLVHVQDINAARILMAMPIGTRSHHNFFMPLAEHLAQRNHTVTYLSGYELPNRQPNIHLMFIPNTQIYNTSPNLLTSNIHNTLGWLFNKLSKQCIKVLNTKEVQSLKDEKFDLILLNIAANECFLSFAHNLKVPFIFVNPNKIVGVYATAAGSPVFSSLNVNFFLDLPYPLTFTGRMLNTLYDTILILFYDWFILSSQYSECRAHQLCPEDMPNLHDFIGNSSLVITNSVRTLETPTQPYTPTVIHAGGIHCRPANPLSEDLEQWIDGAEKQGFIFFSLGSLFKPSSMPEKYRKILVEVFGSLQQRVLWKWDEDTMDDLPSNVRLSKWLPQQDILGHPQLRLFITHGGLLSIQEATYHEVPVLGIPVSLDQHHNMGMVQQEGWGCFLFWEDLTYDSLRHKILHIIDDPEMKKQVKWRSKVMRDAPLSPGDWATYWVEYVLRHQGATHLRSPVADIPWYQLFNADVWSSLVVLTVMIFVIVFWLFNKILWTLIYCYRGPRKTKND